MDILYIGTQFSVRVAYKNSEATFDSAPYIVLRNKAANKYIGKTTQAVAGSNAYSALFTKADTLKLIPGVYNIEVYSSNIETSTAPRMLKCFYDHVRAELAASAGESHHQEEFDNEDSSSE